MDRVTAADVPASIEVEPVTRTGVSLYPAQTIRSTKDGDAPTVASFLLKPGAAALKVTLRSEGGAVLDRWTQSLSVPNYAEASLKIGTPRVFRARTPAESRAFEADPEPTPTASRHFRRTDRLVIDVPFVAEVGEPSLEAKLTNRDGQVLAPLTLAEGPENVARVILPLAIPGIVANAVFVFVLSWNDYLFSVVLVVDESRKTLPVGVAGFADSTSVEWGLMMAGGVLITLPIMVGFAVVQRWLIQGLSAGAIKG